MATRRSLVVAVTPPGQHGGDDGGSPPRLARAAKAFVVVVHAGDPSQLGRRIAIPDDAATDVGAAGGGIVLGGDDDIAPRHLTLTWRKGQLWLVPHEARLLLEGSPVEEPRRLRSGARIDVGGTVLVLLIGEHVDAEYFELIYRLTSRDSVTGLMNRRMFEETCASGTRRADDAIVRLDVHCAGSPFEVNRALERAARALRAHANGRPIGRVEASSFDILCERMSPDEATAWAVELVALLERDGVRASVADVQRGSRWAGPGRPDPAAN